MKKEPEKQIMDAETRFVYVAVIDQFSYDTSTSVEPAVLGVFDTAEEARDAAERAFYEECDFIETEKGGQIEEQRCPENSRENGGICLMRWCGFVGEELWITAKTYQFAIFTKIKPEEK